jgi:hypothetical protein
MTAFVGKEQSNSPAKGLLTLFLVGLMPRQAIVDTIDQAQVSTVVVDSPLHLSHIYFGSGMSFTPEHIDDWASVIRFFLQEGFWCSLEMKAAHLPLVRKTLLCRKSRFIPVVHFDIPHHAELGQHATLRIGESWSSPIATIMQSNPSNNEQRIEIT